MGAARIKVKAMGVFVANGAMLVTPGFDSVKDKRYYRLPGGHVEFGERAEETLRREMQEELAADVEVRDRLETVENIFQYEGRDHHEVIFIHAAVFLDEAITRRNDLRNLEAGHSEVFRWLPLATLFGGPLPLYPRADYQRHVSRITGNIG